MTDKDSKKDVSYLPRSWGSRAWGGKTHEKPLPDSPEPTDSEVAEESTIPLAVQPCRIDEAPFDPEEDAELGGEFVENHADEGFDVIGEAADDDDAMDPCQYCEARDVLPADTADASETRPFRVKLTLVGVRFGYACKIYHFDAAGIDLQVGDQVVVKTEKGLGLGTISLGPFEKELEAAQLEGLRKILRKAGRVDFDQKARSAQREAEAYVFCLDRIEELSLPMKLVNVESYFDGSKYVFYFTAEGRVDFRELVKQLVARFPVRIEMRQIGVRHEAKMTGGLGCCGQELCCSRYLVDFRPVSVKMAKTQNLSLNPSKISGVCGRLMCCLAYEHEIYEEFRKGLPRVGKTVKTTRGEGVVLKHNPLGESVFVRFDEDTVVEYTRDDLIADVQGLCPKKIDKEPAPPPKPGRGNRSKARGSKQSAESG